jgi:Tfp pilus assembly protein PilO
MKSSTALILILISAGVAYTFITPQYEEVKALRDQASNYQNILDNVAELTTKRDQLLVKYQAIPKSEVDSLAKVLPDHIDTVRLAMDFDSIAAKYGISIKRIEVLEDKQTNNNTIVQATPRGGYNATMMSFNFTASYDSYRKFLHDIEQSLRIIDVKSVAFKTSDVGLYDFQISIKTYWLK